MGTGAKLCIVCLMAALVGLSLAVEREIGRCDGGALIPRLLDLPAPPALTIRAVAVPPPGTDGAGGPSPEAGPAPTPSGPQAPAVRTYLVREGDTLGRIAQIFYGRSALWRPIYDANRDTLSDPHRLRPGTTLRVPAIEHP